MLPSSTGQILHIQAIELPFPPLPQDIFGTPLYTPRHFPFTVQPISFFNAVKNWETLARIFKKRLPEVRFLNPYLTSKLIFTDLSRSCWVLSSFENQTTYLSA